MKIRTPKFFELIFVKKVFLLFLLLGFLNGTYHVVRGFMSGWNSVPSIQIKNK